MKHGSAIVASIAIVCAIALLVFGAWKAGAIRLDYDAKFKDLVEQTNNVQKLEHGFDKKQSARADAIAKDLADLASKQENDGLISKSLSIGNGALSADVDSAIANGLRFSNAYSGYPESSNDRSEAANDATVSKKLLIAGNRSAETGKRTVGIFDRLDVHGDGVATDWVSGENVLGENYVAAGNWKAYASSAGDVYASGRVDASDVRARSSMIVGSNAWIRADGSAMLSSGLSIGSGAPEDLVAQKWRAGADASAAFVRFANEDGSGVNVRSTDKASDKYGLRVENATGRTFQVANDGSTSVGGTIASSAKDRGSMIEANYGGDANRYGIGQWPNGATRVYAPAIVSTASVNMGFAKSNGSFEDVLKITPTGVIVSKDLNVQNKQLSAGGFKSTGADSNWLHAYRAGDDQLSMGADGNNKGISSVGDKPIAFSTNGRPRLTIDASAPYAKVSASNLSVGASVDENRCVSAFSHGGDGADVSGNYPGGLLSAYGIGFKNGIDGATRFVHDTKTGDTATAGAMNVGGDLLSSSDVTFDNQNAWKIMTPDDNRREMSIVPSAGGGSWKLSAQAKFDPTGSMYVSGKATASSNLCIGDVCISKDDLLRFKLPPPPSAVDCAVTDWTGWGACSKSCGSGVQTRSRAIKVSPLNGGKPCPSLQESQACNTQACPAPAPVNCAVSTWNSWSTCSKTCGGGTRTRTRTIALQPANGGTACPSLSESQACNTQACPIPTDCAVSAWSLWSACSKTCGGGTRTRTRTITRQPANGGAACPSLSESQACNTQACPVPTNCTVSSWGLWSSCSKSCGGGTRTRTRAITKQATNGGSCPYTLSESQACNTQSCPYFIVEMYKDDRYSGGIYTLDSRYPKNGLYNSGTTYYLPYNPFGTSSYKITTFNGNGKNYNMLFVDSSDPNSSRVTHTGTGAYALGGIDVWSYRFELR